MYINLQCYSAGGAITGRQIAEGVNTKTAYDAVNTPKIDGYEAQIKSTNANGVTVGSAADLDIPDEIVKDVKVPVNTGYYADKANVPGYTTSIVSVTPGVPGEDTPVEVPTTPALAKEAPQAAAELPQMGDANETTMAAVDAAIVAATLGLVDFGVKKKDEKNF
ncbi:hypothetical protein [Ligilactobacillus animalis]|uniref:hypothetical protein n=1 Tax=Ligilactobacillus animalis TaxID=1605 RepID=UPI0027C8E7FC|nr:hypothetical protein [Ligilactobacillus animalis]MDQ2234878.1 hypothetical protein [Ligilactobacillus animalis]